MRDHPLVRLARLRRIVPLLDTLATIAGTALVVGGMLALTALAFAVQP